MIDEGRFKNIAELVNVLSTDSGVVTRTLHLTLLSLKIIHKIICGESKLATRTVSAEFSGFQGRTGDVFLSTATHNNGRLQDSFPWSPVWLYF